MSNAFVFAEQSGRDAPSKARKRRRAAAPGANRRARLTNNPLSTFDRNSPEGRRGVDLAQAFIAETRCPADNVYLMSQIMTAARLCALAEKAEAEALRAPSFDVDHVIRARNAADRAERRLGIAQRKIVAPAPVGSLADHFSRPTGVE